MNLADQKDFAVNGIRKIFKGLVEKEEDIHVLYEYNYNNGNPHLFCRYSRPNGRAYGETIGSFSIREIDGGQNLFFGESWLLNNYRNRGYGVKLHNLRCQLALEVCALSAIATSRKDNDSQNRIFSRFGWEKGNLNQNHYIWYLDLANFKPIKRVG